LQRKELVLQGVITQVLHHGLQFNGKLVAIEYLFRLSDND